MEKFIWYSLAGLGALVIALIFIPTSHEIQPTDAFSRIIIDNGMIDAKSYNDMLRLDSVDSMNITMNGNKIELWPNWHLFNSTLGSMVYQSQNNMTNSFGTIIINGVNIKATTVNSTIIINTQGSQNCTVSGNTVTCKLSQITCPILQGLKGVDANGNLFCATI